MKYIDIDRLSHWFRVKQYDKRYIGKPFYHFTWFLSFMEYGNARSEMKKLINEIRVRKGLKEMP